MNLLHCFTLIFVLFCVILIIFALILHILKQNCVFIFNDYTIKYKSSANKIKYLKLKYSNTQAISKQFFKKKNQLFSLSSLNKNKPFLQTLSRLVDFKINNNKLKYRAKGTETLIEEISKSCISNFISGRCPNIFISFKQAKLEYGLKQKELKIFKMVLARDLFLYIGQNKKILDVLMKIIKKSKNAKCLRFYDNNIYFYSNIYGICNFNKNSNAIVIKNNIDLDYMIARFYKELYRLKFNIDVAVNYLLVMFS